MGVDRRIALAAALLAPALLPAQRSILDRPVEVHANNVRLSEALAMIARDGGFKLSYNSALVKGDSVVNFSSSGTVEAVMRPLVGRRIRMKESGAHLILLEEGTGRRKFTATGTVVDRATGDGLAMASIHEVSENNSAITDAQGHFSIELSGRRDRTPLLLSRRDHRDTVVYVGRDGGVGRVALQALGQVEHMEVRCEFDRCAVEELGVARLLVPEAQMDQASNMTAVERRTIQASLWPSVGTNRKISGAVVNQWSFNLLAGYARGLEGFELGVGVNIEREDVKGAQIAGLANLVGRNTSGVQVAGGLNHTMRSLNGLQIGGLGNTVWDTLSGVQIGGGANVVKGGMRGTQFAGFCNVTTQKLDGAQIAGGVNVTVKDVNKAQVAGGFNYGREVRGAQVAGGLNFAWRGVGGGQVAGGINYARQVTGGQVAGGVNVAVDTVRGGQVGVVNFGRVVEGGQVGILNVSDTISGGSVGFLSFAWRGYHRFEFSTTDALPFTMAFRTGTRAFHNTFSYSPPLFDERWGFGYGMGTEARLGQRGCLNIEVTAEHVNEQTAWIDAVNILGRLEVLPGLNIGRHVVLFAGPTCDLLFSDWRDAEGNYLSTIAPANPLADEIQDDLRLQTWIGFRAGLGLRF